MIEFFLGVLACALVLRIHAHVLERRARMPRNALEVWLTILGLQQMKRESYGAMRRRVRNALRTRP